MERHRTSVFLCGVLSLTLASIGGAQGSPAHGAFAYPNEDASRLLSTAEIANPEALRAALCTGNRPLTVQFDRRQMESKASTGRQTARNFGNTAGAVFRIVGGSIDSTATCFLTPESLMIGSTAIALTRPAEGARCPRSHYALFETDKGRAVVACWPIAESASGTEIAIIEFSRRLTHALASLVVIDGERRAYVDYPAEFNGPGADLWRADDGGEIHPEGFEVVFFLKRGSSYVAGISWAGAEGVVLSLLTAADSGQFQEMITDSWYRSPL